LLRGLRQRVEFARMQTGRHEEIARAFGGRGRDDRRLVLAELAVPHAAAHRGDHIRAQGHVALQLLAAQVEVAVFEPRLFGIFLIAEHHERQLGGRAQHFHIADEDFDFARRDLGVHQIRIACFDVPVDTDAPFRAHFLDLGEHRAIGIAEHLRDAVVIAQVDEQNTAMIAHPVNPARQADGFADVIFGQSGTSMAAIGVHGVSLPL